MAVWLGVVLSLALSPQTVEIPAAAEPEPVAVEAAPAAPADPRAEAAAARAAHIDRLGEAMERILAERAAEAETETAERARREAEAKERAAPFELRFEPPPLPDFGIESEDAQRADDTRPGPVLEADPQSTSRDDAPWADTRPQPPTIDFVKLGAVVAALALAGLLWWLWRHGMVRLAFERGVRPYWREGALFTLLGAILIKIW